MRNEGTVVGFVCVRLCVSVNRDLTSGASVNRDLTSGASVRPENDITYSMGNEGQKIVWISLKRLHCRDTLLSCIVWLMIFVKGE